MKRAVGIRSLALFLVVTVCAVTGFSQATPVSQEKVPDGNKAAIGGKGAGVKVTFEAGTSGVVIVEVNGERLRIDTVRQTVEPVTQEDEVKSLDDSALKSSVPDQDDEKKDDKYDFDKGYEPFDHRIVNLPTPKHIPKGSWNTVFTHRFTQQIDPIRESAPNLFGLDSFGVASFGVTYGITDRLYASAYRSPVCERGMCKVIEVGVGYNWFAMDKERPYALTTYASVEGNDNLTEEYTYNLQVMLAGRMGKRVFLFFSPAVHINSNGQRRFDPRPNEVFPPSPLANTFRQPVHGATFGFGASVMITPNVIALFDVAARTGFKLGRVVPIRNNSFQVIGFEAQSHPSIGFGIQRNIGLHSFALTFSNTQTTTTSRYNSSNLVLSPKRFTIGFNLSRRF